MAKDQRASMREGPLAALFRATDESLEDSSNEIEVTANGNGGIAVAEPEPQVVDVEPKVAETDIADAEVEVVEAPKPKRKPAKKTKTSAKPKQKPKAKTKPKAKPEPEPEPTPEPEAFVDAPVEDPEVTEPEEVEVVEQAEVEETVAPQHREGLRNLISESDDAPAYGRGPDPHRYAPVPRSHNALLRVVGVGGGGVNAVNRMVEAQIEGVEFIAINTDVQSLQNSNADIKLDIGAEMTRGLGSGSDPRVGYRAAFEAQDEIKDMLKGSDMVFVAAGAGGGTGTGAAPVVAKLARDVGALTVGIVTKPFTFEGARRSAQAEEGISALSAEVDTTIVVPNEKLLSVLERRTSITDAFAVADDVLRQAVQGISDLVMLPGLINLDFADVRTTMMDAGDAILGIGMGSGDHRAMAAAEKAVRSPLLDTSVEGAQSMLLSVTGGSDLSLLEAADAAQVVREAAHPEANIIFGANVDEDLGDQVWVTVIATRFDTHYARSQRRRMQRDRDDDRRRPPSSASTVLRDSEIPQFDLGPERR